MNIHDLIKGKTLSEAVKETVQYIEQHPTLFHIEQMEDEDFNTTIDITLTTEGIHHFGWDKHPYGWDPMQSLQIYEETGILILDGDFDYPKGYQNTEYHFSIKE